MSYEIINGQLVEIKEITWKETLLGIAKIGGALVVVGAVGLAADYAKERFFKDITPEQIEEINLIIDKIQSGISLLGELTQSTMELFENIKYGFYELCFEVTDEKLIKLSSMLKDLCIILSDSKEMVDSVKILFNILDYIIQINQSQKLVGGE